MASFYTSYTSRDTSGRLNNLSPPTTPPSSFSSTPLTDSAVLPPRTYRQYTTSEHATRAASHRCRLDTHPFSTPAILRANTSPTIYRSPKTWSMPLPTPRILSRSPIRHRGHVGLRACQRKLAAAYEKHTVKEMADQKRFARQTANEMADVSLDAAFAIFADTNAEDVEAANILVGMMAGLGVGEEKRREDEEVIDDVTVDGTDEEQK